MLAKVQIVETIIEEQEETVTPTMLIKDLIMTKVKDVEHLHSIINMESIFDFVSYQNYSLNLKMIFLF
jgi:hypothetical protein